MFFGTKLWFRLIYFFTAMSPAYILFITKLIISFQFDPIFGYKVIHFLIMFALILIIILSTIFLKGALCSITKSQENLYSLNLETETKIEEVNGEVVSFLIGVIIPTVFFLEECLLPTIIMFILIQAMSFLLISKSNTIFPNVILILFGINIYSLKNGKFLISNLNINELNNKYIEGSLLGDNSSLICYVI